MGLCVSEQLKVIAGVHDEEEKKPQYNEISQIEKVEKITVVVQNKEQTPIQTENQNPKEWDEWKEEEVEEKTKVGIDSPKPVKNPVHPRKKDKND